MFNRRPHRERPAGIAVASSGKATAAPALLYDRQSPWAGLASQKAGVGHAKLPVITTRPVCYRKQAFYSANPRSTSHLAHQSQVCDLTEQPALHAGGRLTAYHIETQIPSLLGPNIQLASSPATSCLPPTLLPRPRPHLSPPAPSRSPPPPALGPTPSQLHPSPEPRARNRPASPPLPSSGAHLAPVARLAPTRWSVSAEQVGRRRGRRQPHSPRRRSSLGWRAREQVR